MSIKMEEDNPSVTTPEPNPQVIYRCKKCRRIVASQENVVPHERGGGETCFKLRKRSSDSWNNEKEPPCSSIFVEPMKWMEPGEPLEPSAPLYKPSTYIVPDICRNPKFVAVQDGHVEEKLLCIGCKARLGSFNWAGMQCSCGAWVNPAFKIHRSKVDECKT